MSPAPGHLKIAMIDPSLFTWPYDSALIEGLRAHGHEVTLYTKCLAPGEQGCGAPSTVPLFYPGLQLRAARRLPKRLFLGVKGLSHIFSMARLWLWLWRSRPDIIHFQWAPLPPVDRIFIPLFRKLAPTILTVHDSSPFNNNPTSKVQSLGAIAIISAFDRQIVHTDHAFRQLVVYGVKAVTIRRIEHGILDSGFGEIPEQSVKSADAPVTILLFGKLKPYKGADVLLRAIAALPSDIRNRCQLRIVGKAEMDTAPLFALAQALQIEQQIQWDLRFVNDDEMGKIFSEADIMAIPYRAIDASGVLMVALGMARPIIASRIGLFEEILEDGKTALLVPPENVAALAGALQRLIEDGSLRRQLGQAVTALRTAIPSWDEIAVKTAALYREAMAAR